MWREDDFEDKGRQVKVAQKDEVMELISDPDPPPEGKAVRSDEEPSG